LIDDVHYVLLTLGCICQVLIVLVVAQIVFVCEAERFNVTRYSQHTVLFEAKQSSLTFAIHFLLDAIKEVNLELRPACLNIQPIDLITERLGVLILFLQVIWSKTDQMHLQWHSPPFFGSELSNEILNIVNNAS